MTIRGHGWIIANDLEHNLYDLKDTSLLIIDEAHRCLKNYDYTKVVASYKQQAPVSQQRILGLTASPGNSAEIVNQICAHLNIEEIELRSRVSEDVKPYIQELEFQKIEVPFPQEFIELRVLLKRIFDNAVNKLRSSNFLHEPANKITLLKLQTRLAMQVQGRNFAAMHGMSLTAQAIKISHALELLETQTLSGLHTYLKGLQQQAIDKKSKAVQSLVKTNEFRACMISLEQLLTKKIEHPKVQELVTLVEQEFASTPSAKLIIFTQFRDTASLLHHHLSQVSAAKPAVFVGQAKKETKHGSTGLSQKDQKRIIEQFKSGEINTLIATSVHPDEYIVIKRKERISLEKIGVFVESFLDKPINSKKIEEYKCEALTTDGKKTFFAPITHVHRHLSKGNCTKIQLNSGFDCSITDDHSVFSFNKKGEMIPIKPEMNKFIALPISCPVIEKTKEMDVLEELKKETDEVFGTLHGITQAKIRKLKTDHDILQFLNDKTNISSLTQKTKRDYSTVKACLKRSFDERYITQRKEKKNLGTISNLTEKGKRYAQFLAWFFAKVYYHKRKYRFHLIDKNENKKEFIEFFEQNINVPYGKMSFPRHLELNESLARFLGFYVSEGHARKSKYTSEVHLAARKKKMQDMMQESIENGLHLKPRRNTKGVILDAQIGFYLIRDVFKAGIGAYNKEVPEIIFTAPNNIKWEFLHAYCLGDGHIAKDRIVLTTVSRKLVTGLVLLLRMLGIKKITVYKQKHIYRVNIYESLPFAAINEKNEKRGRTYYGLVPTALSSKRAFDKYENMYHYDKNASVRCRKSIQWKREIAYEFIKRIDPLEKQPKFVYDISVAGTQNFFGGTGLTVLHNSIGEEGLDIPEVNAVFFYEPIPSAVRKIQRTGRTARLSKGKLFILITKDTRDEINHWASSAREKKMYKTIELVKNELKNRKANPSLDSFTQKEKN